MFGSDILDVAIGLIFVYLLLSLICSAVHEIIEAWLKRRATDLERGVRELLQDPDGTGLAGRFYTHPLIFGLFRGGYNPGNIKGGTPARPAAGETPAVPAKPGTYHTNKDSELPSYIPARTFALALMDIFLPAATTGGGERTPSGADAATATPPPAVAGTPNAGQLSKLVTAGAPAGPVTHTPGPSEVERAIQALVDAAGNDASKARENIENWYDSAMDRVSGWYKRRAQRTIFFVGLGVAVLMNVDTIGIARSLATDKQLRDGVARQAEAYAREYEQRVAGENRGGSASAAGPGVGAGTATGKGPTAPADAPPPGAGAAASDPAGADERRNRAEELKRSKKDLDETTAKLASLGLPIGWHADPYKDVHAALQVVFRPLGWLLTAVAVSLGAAFWFDLLNKVMVIRSTVKPREKSPEEGSEDRRRR